MPASELQRLKNGSARQLDTRAAIAALIVLLAFVWRSLGLRGLEVWRDEALTIVDASAPWKDLLFRLPWSEDTPPLNFLLYKIWLTFFPTELGARILPLLAGVATVAVIMVVAGWIRSSSGWAAGLLAAFSYEFLAYSQEIRIYSVLVLFTSLSFLAAEGLLRRPESWRWRALFVAFATVAAHAHAVGLFVFPMVLSYLLVRAGVSQCRRIPGYWPILAWTILALPMIWFGAHWSHFHQQLGNWWNIPPDRTTVDALFRDFSGLMVLRTWSHTGAWHVGPWTAFVLERLVIVAEALLVIAALMDSATRRAAAALLTAALVYAALLTVTSYLALPNVVERTALPGWCPLVLVMGLGASAGRTTKIRILTGSAGLMLAAIWACSWLWFVNSNLDRHDPNAAAFAWLRSRIGPSDLVISAPEGMEDLTVYRLNGAIPADQLLCSEHPVYTGFPPRPMLIPRIPDPHWKDRMARSIRDRLDQGVSFKVWMVRRGLGGDPQTADVPEGVIERTHMRVGRFGYAVLRGMSISEYAVRLTDSRPAESRPVARLTSSIRSDHR